jgi:hypothetical protein
LCESIPGDDSVTLIGNIHHCLGEVYSDTNERQLSLSHKETFLEMQQSICASVGPDFVDMRLCSGYKEMATGLADAGQWVEAIECFEQEMTIRESLGITYFLARDANYAMALIAKGNLELAEKVLLHSKKLWESTGSPVSLR